MRGLDPLGAQLGRTTDGVLMITLNEHYASALGSRKSAEHSCSYGLNHSALIRRRQGLTARRRQLHLTPRDHHLSTK